MHANSVLLTQDGTNMAMPKKKTTPKKKIGKDSKDFIEYVKGNRVYGDKKGNTRVVTETNPFGRNAGKVIVTTVSKQGKSGFSSVKQRTGLPYSKNDALQGRIAPIANPKKAASAIKINAQKINTKAYENRNKKKK